MNLFREHRILRRLAFLLIATQLLLSAPVASAYAAIAAGADGANCAEMMNAGDSAEPCPCCRDAALGVAACLGACTASVGFFVTFTLPPVRSGSEPAEIKPLIHRADLADPPLKPPPIA